MLVTEIQFSDSKEANSYSQSESSGETCGESSMEISFRRQESALFKRLRREYEDVKKPMVWKNTSKKRLGFLDVLNSELEIDYIEFFDEISGLTWRFFPQLKVSSRIGSIENDILDKHRKEWRIPKLADIFDFTALFSSQYKPFDNNMPNFWLDMESPKSFFNVEHLRVDTVSYYEGKESSDAYGGKSFEPDREVGEATLILCKGERRFDCKKHILLNDLACTYFSSSLASDIYINLNMATSMELYECHELKELLSAHNEFVDRLAPDTFEFSFLEEELYRKHSDLDWAEVSKSHKVPWSKDIIDVCKNEVDWDLLSSNTSIPWTNEIIEEYQDRITWGRKIVPGTHFRCMLEGSVLSGHNPMTVHSGLSSNSSLPWSKELIYRYFNKWDWDMIYLSNSLIEILDEFYTITNERKGMITWLAFNRDNLVYPSDRFWYQILQNAYEERRLDVFLRYSSMLGGRDIANIILFETSVPLSLKLLRFFDSKLIDYFKNEFSDDFSHLVDSYSDDKMVIELYELCAFETEECLDYFQRYIEIHSEFELCYEENVYFCNEIMAKHVIYSLSVDKLLLKNTQFRDRLGSIVVHIKNGDIRLSDVEIDMIERYICKMCKCNNH